MYVVVFALSYVACAVFYHSGRKRSAYLRLRESRPLRCAGYTIGGALLLLALIVAAAGQGWERGIPLWLGLITVAGMVSLVLAVTKLRVHLWSAPVALGLSVLALTWGAVA